MTNKEISDVIIECREALWSKIKDYDVYTSDEIKQLMVEAEIEVLRKYFTKT